MFLLVNRFYVLTTQCQQWSDCVLAFLALNIIQTVLLQLKIIPCDSAYAWHTSAFFATNVHLDLTHKYHQQTSSDLIRLHQYNTLLLINVV